MHINRSTDLCKVLGVQIVVFWKVLLPRRHLD